MSVNSSLNNSLLHLHLPSNNRLPFDFECCISRPSAFIFISYVITTCLLLLPLCIVIIYHGLQQWRQKRSTSSAATMSHSDSFTYHMVIMELTAVFGNILWCCIYSGQVTIALVGYHLTSLVFFGEMFFHVLICVERYLAVVHPITYLSLRKERGIRIRNISTWCVWLVSLAGVVLLFEDFVIVDFISVITSLTVVSFCSLSVLCVLIRPGPGEQGGGRQKVDQSKQRAFYTIMVILGVLVMRFGWNVVWGALFVSEGSANCVIITCSIWFNLPSALVLPVLFLLRAGKSVCWKATNVK